MERRREGGREAGRRGLGLEGNGVGKREEDEHFFSNILNALHL